METTNSVEPPPSGAAGPFLASAEIASELARPTSEAMTAFSGSMIATLSSCQREWFGFLGRRMQENMGMPSRLASCRSMPEIQQAYMDYWNRTVDQYQEEFQVLASTIQQTDGKPRAAAGAAARPENGGVRPH